jgi:hypothetical protein
MNRLAHCRLQNLSIIREEWFRLDEKKVHWFASLQRP